MKKETYIINTSTNFSLMGEDYYLVKGDTVDLPSHELVESLVIRGHLTKEEKQTKDTNTKK